MRKKIVLGWKELINTEKAFTVEASINPLLHDVVISLYDLRDFLQNRCLQAEKWATLATDKSEKELAKRLAIVYENGVKACNDVIAYYEKLWEKEKERKRKVIR